jgi:RNA polymerase sigma-70 factor (ECF subfamily)
MLGLTKGQDYLEALSYGRLPNAVIADLEGVPLKQIAEREGVTISAVKSRVRRGRRMLETLLHDCCTFEFSRRGDIMDFWPKAHSGCHSHDSAPARLPVPQQRHSS